ncbi:TRAP family 2,3-diketo-L-gulonate transporter periplasmic 2,3-diketo-L-gulonate-binding protein (plasmid) [Neorhizobium galegae bv. officinalis bv. officinalis str. HAMBI 1141]|uniref:TRAP family 2,3-diketo-L-gulonate transporter periplasmic 2,3-diketo-L-gulonate-binding protein n=1 Tax=Neorhizobium galegae bv. officinalis bv. officinalis str. HAMBI 1141 TaxID=1028801 RepID=A0A068TIC1_NEOGA|nr:MULTISPECIES: TRAP transporter substrate-binding protein [Neorhizobium]MCJ9670973.1 TRAP transporter substrate-binding protein [Neorhizobium sp. SHOUNA12B]MCJ9743257.1 TRAP transporter substrate-binding protein [Neorhizobium sp. SHOUNA12A]CDN57250.1 TRAP family 2,3-diketo-L-gulonate transporter periplasmic 2,3-diketo-L-gulonate-binding protein [Neorhizobium galegae bv. officinalis bv. officinalis str. HAMBI 1141]
MRKLLLTTTALAIACASAVPAFAEFKARNIRVSNGINADHPVGNGINAMQKCLDEKSGGKMKLTAFWGGALGGDLQATQALRSGVQEAVVTSSSPLVGIVPALGVFDLPFLFGNAQEAYKVLDGKFGDMMNQKLDAAGLVNLAYWENGFRNLSNSVRPVTKWEDFSGMKVRVMQNNIFLDTFQNLGANATPMAFGEVFSALETKAIDAQENPYVTIDTSKFFEVQKYVTETNHAYTPFLFLFSKAIFNTYAPDEQAALRACAVVGRDVERQVIGDLNKKSLEKIKAAGLQVNTLSPEEQQRIREKSAVVYEKHKAEIGAEVVDNIVAELKEVRKK